MKDISSDLKRQPLPEMPSENDIENFEKVKPVKFKLGKRKASDSKYDRESQPNIDEKISSVKIHDQSA